VLDAQGHGVISEDGSSNGDAMSFYHNDELVHVLTTSSIKDPALREAKSDSIQQTVREIFTKDIQNSRPVTEADVPKPGLRTSIARLMSNWHVLGWAE
jgi:phosphatidylserine/phosphatidylglycerophosphate/cardiolipin synthase-like enzyme